jgi:hypothetical protein
VSAARVEVVVDGWRFSGEVGGVYVDIFPPACRTAVDVMNVAGVDLSREVLHKLAADWLKEYADDLPEYVRVARWYDRQD